MRRGALGSALVLASAIGLGGDEAWGAQQPDTLVVTLPEAHEIARRNNPDYRRAAAQLELNGPETWAAWASGVLPSLSFTLLNTSYGGNLTRRNLDFFGNPIENPEADFVYTSRTSQGIGMNWQLDGQSPLNRLKRIGAENRRRELGEEVTGEALRLEVQRSFFDALEQEEILALEEAVADATRSDLEAAQRLFELAFRTRVDVLQAELQIEQQRIALRRQQGLRDQARLALSTLLGETNFPFVRPAVTPVPLFDPAELDEIALVERATAASSVVKLARGVLRVAEIDLDDRRGTYWPRLSASFSVGRLVQAPNTKSLFRLGGFGDELYSRFSLGLSLPFFNDVFGNRVAVSRAEVDREGRRDDLRQARIEAERSTRSALLTLRDRWDEVRIAERSLAIATEALELAREEYRLGVRTFEQLQQSVLSEASMRRQLIQVRYGFVDVLVDLETAVGGPVR